MPRNRLNIIPWCKTAADKPVISVSTALRCRHCVSAELDAELRGKVAYSLYKPDAADLKEIVRTFSASRETLNNAQHKAEIAVDKLLARFHVAMCGAPEQFGLLLLGQHF